MVTPEGHLKEDIIWRFIIGDNDDWDNYVYSDNSVTYRNLPRNEMAIPIVYSVEEASIEG